MNYSPSTLLFGTFHVQHGQQQQQQQSLFYSGGKSLSFQLSVYELLTVDLLVQLAHL